MLICFASVTVSAATMSGALYGVAGLFPSEYMTAVVSGQALGGILTALAFILVLAFDAGPSATAFVFFIMGALLIFGCIVCYLLVDRQSFFKYYLQGGDKYKVISALPSHSRTGDETGVPLEPILSQVMSKIYVHAVALALLYATTLSVYPAITILMQSEYHASHTEWTGKSNELAIMMHPLIPCNYRCILSARGELFVLQYRRLSGQATGGLVGAACQ